MIYHSLDLNPKCLLNIEKGGTNISLTKIIFIALHQSRKKKMLESITIDLLFNSDCKSYLSKKKICLNRGTCIIPLILVSLKILR